MIFENKQVFRMEDSKALPILAQDTVSNSDAHDDMVVHDVPLSASSTPLNEEATTETQSDADAPVTELTIDQLERCIQYVVCPST